MPTYEFRAPDGSIHERSFRMSEVPQSITLDDGTVAERMISAGVGLLFKGEGFYITDYGKDGKKDQRAAAAKSAADTKADSAAPKADAPQADTAPKADAPKADAPKAASPAPKAEAKPAAPATPKAD
jgi:predicted nucleic acid-binding Zn ribbon protein